MKRKQSRLLGAIHAKLSTQKMIIQKKVSQGYVKDASKTKAFYGICNSTLSVA